MPDNLNMYEDIKNFYKQCHSDTDVKIEGQVDKIVIAGMGGSAIGGDLLTILIHQVPVVVSRDYQVPNFVNENTLVFVNSFSGNTEETVASFQDAINKKAKIVAISKGGKVKEIAQQNNIPFIELSVPNHNMQPRAGLGYSFFPILKVLENSGFVQDVKDDVEETIAMLKDDEEMRMQAEEMAKNLTYKIPVVYASERFKTVAERWKTQLNENSKIMAFYNSFSEMNHNEIMGYQHVPDHLHVILLRSDDDNERIKKRMDICSGIMKVGIEEVFPRGDSELTKMFSLIHFGDWVSYYLALLNEVDPSSIDAIDTLKEELAK